MKSLPTWPHYDDEQIAAVTEVLRSGKVNYWTGEVCRAFEREYAEALGAKHAIALANGTVALELALQSLGIGAGDEVIVPSRTFLATASCVVVRGATPVFADVDRVSQNITAETIEPLITPRTRAVICVHLAGWPCDMDPILALARRHNLKVIEDCAQSHGAEYKGRPVGTLGDVGCFSFCQDKILTTGGEGGLLVMDDEDLWKRAWSYKDHGKGWDTVHHAAHPGLFRWLHESVGTNWRMTEMQAALGRIQLQRLPDWIATRRRHATRLNERLAAVEGLRLTVLCASDASRGGVGERGRGGVVAEGHGDAETRRHGENQKESGGRILKFGRSPSPFLPLSPSRTDVKHSYYKYYAFIHPESLAPGWDRDRIARTLQAAGVPCGSGSCPEIYEERAFRSLSLGPARRHTVARELGETSLMFLVHPTLEDRHIDFFADRIVDVLRSATARVPAARAA